MEGGGSPWGLGSAILFLGEGGTYFKIRTPRRVAPVLYSGGHDAHKASTRPLHARLAYVMRVENLASVAYAADSARSAWEV
jgi:hypothetical protein